MIARSRSFDVVCAVILMLAALMSLLPFWLALTTASHDTVHLLQHRLPLLPGDALPQNLAAAWDRGGMGRALFNSLLASAAITLLKLVLAASTAFAIVFFDTRLRTLGLAVIVATLMLPLEGRVAPTYGLAADLLAPLHGLVPGLMHAHWSLLDSYAGLTLPVVATATGTIIFRQIFLTIPPSLVDAAKADGAGAWRFIWDVALPLSRGNLVAFAAVSFMAAWNQYLWPLLIITRPHMHTAILALVPLLPDPQDPAPAWNITMAGAILVTLPPLLVMWFGLRWVVRGMVSSPARP